MDAHDLFVLEVMRLFDFVLLFVEIETFILKLQILLYLIFTLYKYIHIVKILIKMIY